MLVLWAFLGTEPTAMSFNFGELDPISVDASVTLSSRSLSKLRLIGLKGLFSAVVSRAEEESMF